MRNPRGETKEAGVNILKISNLEKGNRRAKYLCTVKKIGAPVASLLRCRVSYL